MITIQKWWRRLVRKGRISDEVRDVLSDPKARREFRSILQSGTEGTVTTEDGKTYRITRSQPREK